jgi:O-antigen/teichoic acid export membrane protein
VAGVPYLLHRLGVEAYGVIGVVAVVVSQLAWLQLGVGPATTRRVAEAVGRRDREALWAFFRVATLIGLGAGVVGGLVLLVVGRWLVGRAIASGALTVDVTQIVAAGAVTVLATSLSASRLAGVLGQEQFHLLAAIRVVQGAGRVAAAVGAVAAGLGLAGVMWAQAAVDLATSMLLLSFGVSREEGASARPALSPYVRDLLGLGFPFAVTGGLLALLTDAEKIVMALARPIGDFAFYSVPHNVALRIGALAMAFAGNLVPRLAFLGVARGVSATLAMMNRASRVALGLTGAGLALLIAVVPELLGAWLGHEFAAVSSRPARLLLLVVLVNTGGSTYNAFLRAQARPIILVLVYLVQILPYMVFLYLLVRGWGVDGAAAALFLRSVLDFACHRYAAHRALGGRLRGAGGIAVALVPLLCLTLICEVAGQRWLVVRGLLGLAVAALVLTRLVSRDDWRTLIRLTGLVR